MIRILRLPIILITTLCVVFTFSFAFAAEQGTPPQQVSPTSSVDEIVYSDPTGPEVVYSDNGTIKKITVVEEASLNFPDDRDEVNDAIREATLKGKAHIAKFLSETIKSEETLDSMAKTLSEKKTDGSSSATKTTIKTNIQKISANSEAILKGVVVLEQEIDRKAKLVRIKIGVSEKSMRAADTMKNNMQKDLSGEPPQNSRPTQQTVNPTKEIRKSKNADNF